MTPTKSKSTRIATRKSARIAARKELTKTPSPKSLPQNSREPSPSPEASAPPPRGLAWSRAIPPTNTDNSGQDTPGQRVSSTNRLQGDFALQSLELMKITLHVTIATLFFARGLLPEACFAEAKLRNPRFGPKPRLLTYEQFMQNELSPGGAEELPFPGAFLKIKKGIDRKADSILTHVEEGVFNALAKFHLQAVQFDVAEDQDNLQQVLESYTISTSYEGWLGGANRLHRTKSVVEVDDPKDNKRSLAETKKGLGSMAHSLLALSTRLPKLPRERCSSHDPISFPVCQGWEKASRGCGEFNTGFHSASLKVSYLRRGFGESSGSAIKRALALQQPYQQSLPSGKEYGESIRAGADIEMPRTELVSNLGESDDSGDDMPTAALVPFGAVAPVGPPRKYRSCREWWEAKYARRRDFTQKKRKEGPCAFTEEAAAEASMKKARKKARRRARWLNGEVPDDYPVKLDGRCESPDEEDT
ncbi:hypothetical protein N7512_009995 [Penicillium capsulatum]|nr:hypothetical protein N7512_009995 [Penicillium capsulatum]